MPVIREERRNLTQSSGGGVVRMEGGSQGWQALAQAGGQFAGEMGRLMGELTEHEARVLGDAVTLDENHQPQFRGTEQQRARMGAVAARAFDTTFLPRQRMAIEADLALALDRVRDENLMNPEGFLSGAMATVEGVLEATPVELHGAVQDASRRMIEQTSSRLGWQVAQHDRAATSEQFSVNAGRVEDEVWNLTQQGRLEEAAAMAAELEAQGLDLERRRVVTPQQRDVAIRNVNAARGAGELMGTVNGEDATAAQLLEIRERLLLGSDAELNARFASAQERQHAASLIGEVATIRAREEATAREAADMQAKVDLAASGAAPATDEYRDALDLGLSASAGRPLTHEDWANGALPQAAVWNQIRAAGMLPSSLRHAFNRFDRGTLSAAQAEQMHATWSTLTRGRAPDGMPTTLASEIPEEVHATFHLTEIYAAGGMGFEEAWRKARETAHAPPDDAVVAARMNREAPRLFPKDQRETFTPDNVDERVGTMLAERLGRDLDMVLSTEDRATASRLFLTMIADDRISAKEAYREVEKAFTTRMIETEYVWEPGRGPVSRSNFAPELHFALPAEDWRGWLDEATGYKRPWFGDWAEAEIRRRAAPDAILPEGALNPREFYHLVPERATTGKPIYRVVADVTGDGFPEIVRDAAGLPILLDASPAYAAARKPRDDRAAAREAAAIEAERARIDAGPQIPVSP